MKIECKLQMNRKKRNARESFCECKIFEAKSKRYSNKLTHSHIDNHALLEFCLKQHQIKNCETISCVQSTQNEDD